MPEPLYAVLLSLAAFFERGGTTLFALLAVAVLMWSLILERYWFFWRIFPGRLRAFQGEWAARAERRSLRAHRIREAMISEARLQLQAGIPVIATLVAICPMLGLLGTVTGMIEVFDVMALKGTSDARAMAGGVSRATIPTMSGMVLALPGLFFVSRCRYLSRRLAARLTDELRFD